MTLVSFNFAEFYLPNFNYKTFKKYDKFSEKFFLADEILFLFK